MASNYARRIIRGSATVLGFSAIGAGLAYAVRVLFARHLDPAQYGLIYSIFAVVTIAALFAEIGLGQSIAKHVSQFMVKKQFGKIKGAMLSVAVIYAISFSLLTVILIAANEWLAQHYFQTQDAVTLLPLIALSFFINSFVFIIWYTLQGMQRMGWFASVDAVRMAIVLVVSWLLLSWGFGLKGVGFAYVVAPAIILICYFLLFTEKIFPQWNKIEPAFSKGLVKSLYKFGIPVSIGISATIILNLTDTVMLTYLSDLTAVGLYNVALPTAKLLLYFGIAIGATMFPIVSELVAKKQKSKLKAGLEQLYHYSFMLIMPFALLIFAFPEVIIRVLFGIEYLGAGIAMQILGIAAFVMVLAQININIIAGMGKPKVNAKYMYYGAGINVILNAIFIPLYGIIAAAATTLVSFLLILILNTQYLQKQLKIIFPLKEWLLSGGAGLGFIVVVLLLKAALEMPVFVELGVVIGVGLITYVSLLYAFKLVNTKDIKQLMKTALK